MNDNLRIIEDEYQDLVNNPILNFGITIQLKDDDNIHPNYREWKCSIIGPRNSPYKGGLFILYVEFPKEYPNECPTIYFKKSIYHTNVNPKKGESAHLGEIFISLFHRWRRTFTMREALINIFALFFS